MSTLLSVQSVSYETSIKKLFKNISFSIQTGERIGLIGHNGSGKSTLLHLITQQLPLSHGSISFANHCVYAYIEQHLPSDLSHATVLEAVLSKLSEDKRMMESWRAEILLAELGFHESQYHQNINTLSGGQHTRLLLGRALMNQPDLLFLDEPSNHLDLPTILWLTQFLQNWRGTFVLVSHDQNLLDQVTNTTWILRDESLHHFQLPCSEARQALIEQDIADEHRHKAEQKEIDRITVSAKRLALWGKTYDNESFARKAKKMEKQIAHLEDQQTVLTEGYQWQLQLNGRGIKADRVLALENAAIYTPSNGRFLFQLDHLSLKSGDKLAIIGENGCGKSSFLQSLWQKYLTNIDEQAVRFHPAIKVGYYDQQLKQLLDDDSLLEALSHFAPLPENDRKMALIKAGFVYNRHHQKVSTLSGGERSRLLFIGLSLGQYELLLLDEPTNHLDMEGKEALAEQIAQFEGAIILVSHDQWLIENSCQRFGLIHHQEFMEYNEPESAYHVLLGSTALNIGDNDSEIQSETFSIEHEADIHEDLLLREWVELEQKLNDDLARKPTHQKPLLQKQWQERLLEIEQLLNK